MAHLNFLVLLLKPFFSSSMCILVRQNTTASSAAKNWLSRLPYRCLYPRADAILCQSAAMASDLAANFAIPPSRLKVLANPVNVNAIRAASAPTSVQSPGAWPRLLAVGRLAKEKGMDLLLRALHEVRQQHPQVHLTILGTGPEEASLRRLSRELSLETAVSLPGYSKNPADFYAQSTLFVLPSHYEGMPNALLEAAAAGLPLAATPCSAGLCDLLQNAPGTWLAPAISAESLAKAILAALATLASPPLRFQHAFLAPFEARTAITAYAALIESSARTKP
jgi:glycosyltransferase involved in cell wall biosynthesis